MYVFFQSPTYSKWRQDALIGSPRLFLTLVFSFSFGRLLTHRLVACFVDVDLERGGTGRRTHAATECEGKSILAPA